LELLRRHTLLGGGGDVAQAGQVGIYEDVCALTALEATTARLLDDMEALPQIPDRRARRRWP
jgi:hypothetical protein